MISEKADECSTVTELIHISRHIYETPGFVFYAIADALFFRVEKDERGTADLIRKKSSSSQGGFCPTSCSTARTENGETQVKWPLICLCEFAIIEIRIQCGFVTVFLKQILNKTNPPKQRLMIIRRNH